MVDWGRIRIQFPAIRDVTYLNTAGGGPLCRYAAHEARTYYEEMLAYGDTLWDEWLERTEATRRQLASLIRVSPGEIAFLANTSLGMNLLAELFYGVGEVLTMADDFPSVTLPWLHRDYPVRFLESRSDGTIPVNDIEGALSSTTRILATSHVQYRTGFRMELSGLSELCRSRGILLIVDATQSFGTLRIDLEDHPVDALVFSGYKWMTAGYGIASLYVRKKHLESRRLPGAGWRTAKQPYALVNDLLDLTTEASGLELGHPPFPGIFALRGALRLIEEIGLDNIEARIQELTDYLHKKMDAAGISVTSPRAAGTRGGITMLGVSDPADVKNRLNKKNIFTSARGPALRVALHFYNTHEDIDRLAGALAEIA